MSVANLMVTIAGNVSNLVTAIAQAQQSLNNLNAAATATASTTSQSMTQATQSAQGLSASLTSMHDAAAVVTGAVAALGAALAGVAVAGVHGLAEAELAMARTAAVVRSTGGEAGVAAEHLQELSVRMEQLSGMAAESVQQGGNWLLTFTNIRNVAGEGNNVFDQTIQAMSDMAALMGMDAAGAAMQLGKALNDPVAGIAALSRAGVSFSDSQKAVIKSLVDTGQVLEAQKMILAELRKEFGGQAEAVGATFTGAMQRVQHALGDVAEEAARPIFIPLINTLNYAQEALLSFANAIGEKGLARAILDIIAPTEAARLAVVAFSGAVIAMMIPSLHAAYVALIPLLQSFRAIAPVAAAGAVIALVAYGIYRAWEAVGPMFARTWDQVNQATAASLGYLSSAMQLIVARVQWMAHAVSSLVQAGFGVARSYVQNIMANIVLLVHRDIQALHQLFGFVPQTMLAAFNRAVAYADANFLQPIMNVLRTIGKGFQAFAGWLGVTFPAQALDGLRQIGSGVINFAKGTVNAVTAPFTAVRDTVRGAWASLTRTTSRAPMPVMPAVAPTIERAGDAAAKAAPAVKALADAQKVAAQSAKAMADENLALASLTDAQRAQIQAAQQYGQALADNAARQALFGFSVQDTESLIRATEQAMVALVVNGMDPASEQVAYLRFQIADLTDQLKRNQLATLGSTTESGKMADASKANTTAAKDAANALDIAEASIRGVRSVMRELSQALGEQAARWTDFGLEVADAGISVAKAFGSGAIIGIISASLTALALAVKGVTMAYNDATKAQKEAQDAQVKAGKEALDAMRKQEESVQAIGYAYTELIMAAQDAGRALTLDELGGQLEKATEKMRELRMEGVSPLSESYQALRAIQADIETQFRNAANASGQTAMAFRAVGKAGAEAAKQVSAMIQQANSAVESAGSAIGDYLAAAADEMDLSAFETSFADAIRKAVMSAVEKAVTASIVAKGTLSTLIQALQGELTAGRMGAAEALIPKIAQQAEAEARRVGPVIDRLRSAIDAAFVPGKGTVGPADIVAPIRDQAQEIKQTVQDIKRATETLAPSPAMRPGEISAYLPQGRESRQVVINVTGNTVLNDRDADRLGNALVGSMRRAGVAFA